MVPKVLIVMSLLLAVAFVMVSSAQVNAAEKPQVNEAVDAKVEVTETISVNEAGYGSSGGYGPSGYCRHRCCRYRRCYCCSLAEYNEIAAQAQPQN